MTFKKNVKTKEWSRFDALRPKQELLVNYRENSHSTLDR